MKGLERLWKRIATSTVAALLPKGARGERPDWRDRNYRVLFLRHDRIGDMILSTGILRASSALNRSRKQTATCCRQIFLRTWLIG